MLFVGCNIFVFDVRQMVDGWAGTVGPGRLGWDGRVGTVGLGRSDWDGRAGTVELGRSGWDG